MKSKFLLILTFFPLLIFAQSKTLTIKLKNDINKDRVDALVVLCTNELNKLNKLNKNIDYQTLQIFDGKKELAYQIEKKSNDCSDIYFVVDIKAKEKKKISLQWGKNKKSEFQHRTYAELAMKNPSNYDGKKFRGTKFENVTKIKVPSVHTDHDALFKYEGPGWESEKVGYRFYLDWRNATDIFGKKINGLFLKNIGVTDTVAKDDSYHNMQDWGMDIFKVGSSLGIGSIGMMIEQKVNMVSKTDSIYCEISKNGPVISEVKTNYFGWLVGNKKYNLESKLSIAAGSRLSKHSILIKDEPDNLVTGLAKYEGTKFIKSNNNNGWNFIALYGKQSLANDDLGIALFYNQKDLIELTEDNLSHIVKLKTNNGKLEYYFAAAWQQEPNGIKNQKEFEQYLSNTILELNNPIKIEY
ncbi:MAG: DUF4861 domain-containing protein [Melioribacteraceae bacterium]|nr:DUF4861 domain-containing protein [Melioribacteraceae bacterium]